MTYESDENGEKICTKTFVSQKTVYGDCRDCIYYDDYFNSANKYLSDNAWRFRSEGMTESQKVTYEYLEDCGYCEWSGEKFYKLGFSNGYGSTCGQFKSCWGEKEHTVDLNTPPLEFGLIPTVFGGIFIVGGVRSIFVGSFDIIMLLVGIWLFSSGYDTLKKRIGKKFGKGTR